MDLITDAKDERLLMVGNDLMEPILTASLLAALSRLSLAEKVVEAARVLIEHAMPKDCACQGCEGLRAALRTYDKEGK